ncbi:MAG: GFA family protein [Hyphomicrobiales bacterium]|nr:GFA family protein [Hyphomicrobiales bacterium]
MHVTGSCHCGFIAYEAEVDPATARICHCRDCQKLSGSAFRANVRAEIGKFRLLSGEPAIYIKTAESGNKRAHAFCPKCGSPVYTTALEQPAPHNLRIGALDQRAELKPRRRIWCDSMITWSEDISGIEKIGGQ